VSESACDGDVCRVSEHQTKWSFLPYTTSDATVSIVSVTRQRRRRRRHLLFA